VEIAGGAGERRRGGGGPPGRAVDEEAGGADGDHGRRVVGDQRQGGGGAIARGVLGGGGDREGAVGAGREAIGIAGVDEGGGRRRGAVGVGELEQRDDGRGIELVGGDRGDLDGAADQGAGSRRRAEGDARRGLIEDRGAGVAEEERIVGVGEGAGEAQGVGDRQPGLVATAGAVVVDQARDGGGQGRARGAGVGVARRAAGGEGAAPVGGRRAARVDGRAQRELDPGAGGAIVLVVAVEGRDREIAAEVAGQGVRIDLLRGGPGGLGDVLGEERPGAEDQRRADLGGRRRLGLGQRGGRDALPGQPAEVAIEVIRDQGVGRDEVGVGAGSSSRVDERVGEVGDRADQAGRQIFEWIGVEQRGEAIGGVEDDEVAGGVVAEGAAASRDAEVARALAGGGREVAVGVGGQLGDAAAHGDGLAQVLEVIDGDPGADEGAVEGEEDAPTDRAVLIDRRVGTAIVGAGDQRRDGGGSGEERGARDHDDDLLG
jgi:hypothetical protein